MSVHIQTSGKKGNSSVLHYAYPSMQNKNTFIGVPEVDRKQSHSFPVCITEPQPLHINRATPFQNTETVTDLIAKNDAENRDPLPPPQVFHQSSLFLV